MKRDIEQLQTTLSDLVNVSSCTFWACPGWQEPFEDMATCGPCQVVQELVTYLSKRPRIKAKMGGENVR